MSCMGANSIQTNGESFSAGPERGAAVRCAAERVCCRTLHCSCAVWEKWNILLLTSVLYWEKDAIGVFETVE